MGIKTPSEFCSLGLLRRRLSETERLDEPPVAISGFHVHVLRALVISARENNIDRRTDSQLLQYAGQRGHRFYPFGCTSDHFGAEAEQIRSSRGPVAHALMSTAS